MPNPYEKFMDGVCAHVPGLYDAYLIDRHPHGPFSEPLFDHIMSSDPNTRSPLGLQCLVAAMASYTMLRVNLLAASIDFTVNPPTPVVTNIVKADTAAAVTAALTAGLAGDDTACLVALEPVTAPEDLADAYIAILRSAAGLSLLLVEKGAHV